MNDVMVNGKWIVRDRASLTMKRSEILAKAEEYRRAIAESLKK